QLSEQARSHSDGHPNDSPKLPEGTAARKVVDQKGNAYDTFTVNANRVQLDMYYADKTGVQLRTFDRLKESLQTQGRDLIFATNGDMFMENRAPVGLLVINSREIGRLNLGSSPDANFYLKPNGVFGLTPAGPFVMESAQFAAWPDRATVTY